MDINELSVILAKSLVKSEHLEKIRIPRVQLPPNLAARLRQWMRTRRPPKGKLYGEGRRALAPTIAEKIEERLEFHTLKKNEFMASVYQGGAVRFDFGSDIPVSVRKKALAWAKRKGLNPLESPMAKSTAATSTVICGASPDTMTGPCVQQMRYEIRL